MHNAVIEELAIQSWQVSTTVVLELERQLGLGEQGIVALNDVDNVLLVRLDAVALGVEVLDDIAGTVEAGGSGDVVQRRALGQRV